MKVYSLYTEIVIVAVSAVAAVVIAKIESNGRRSDDRELDQMHARLDRIETDLRELQKHAAQLQEQYDLYPPARLMHETLVELESALAELREKIEASAREAA